MFRLRRRGETVHSAGCVLGQQECGQIRYDKEIYVSKSICAGKDQNEKQWICLVAGTENSGRWLKLG